MLSPSRLRCANGSRKQARRKALADQPSLCIAAERGKPKANNRLPITLNIRDKGDHAGVEAV